MHVKHLTRILRLVEIEVVESLHSLNDARQVNKGSEVDHTVHFYSIKSLVLIVIDQLQTHCSILNLHFLISSGCCIFSALFVFFFWSLQVSYDAFQNCCDFGIRPHDESLVEL